jgi:hypothetical protein
MEVALRRGGRGAGARGNAAGMGGWRCGIIEGEGI